MNYKILQITFGFLISFIFSSSVYAAEGIVFPDLSPHHPYHTSVIDMAHRGILEGYPDGTFKPDQPINRAETVKIIVESYHKASFNKDADCQNALTQEKVFPDVPLNQWYAKYLCFAKKKNLIKGYPDGTFKPIQGINFAEASKLITNSMSYFTFTSLKEEEDCWYHCFTNKLEEKRSIPKSIYAVNKIMTRSEISEIYDRLLDQEESGKTLSADRTSLTMAYVRLGAERYVAFNPNNPSRSTDVNIRLAPTTDQNNFLVDTHTGAHKLKSNELINAIGSPTGDWQKVKYYDGREGYIHKAYLKEDPTANHVIQKMHYEKSSNGFEPVRLPRQPCLNKFDWKFQKGSEVSFLAYAASDWNPDKKVYKIEPAYFPFYEKMGGVCSPAGGPLSNRESTGSSHDTNGFYQAFENARIYESHHGTYSVTGEIFKVHENESQDDKRGTWGRYGFPISSAKKENGKLVQYFENNQKIEVEAPRLFKTSVENVKIRSDANSSAEELATLSKIKTEINVTGRAVVGEYIDAYKTDRWYPVEYDGKRGFVLATLLHMKMFGDIELDDNFNYTGFDRGKSRITGIVLHATLGNNSAKNDRAALPVKGVGAHYYIDRDGNIAQSTPDYLGVGHVGYGGDWKNVRRDGNMFTIGVELSNWGPVDIDSSSVQKNAYNNIIDVEVTNIELVKESIWKIWNYFHIANPNSDIPRLKEDQGNVTWAGFGSENNEHISHWQTYTDKQLEILVVLIEYLEERYGIPVNSFFEYENPNSYDNMNFEEIKKYSHYYFPKNVKERVGYNSALKNWIGIYQHHNVTGKFDAGPGLDIDRLIDIRNNLNY